MDLFLTVTLKGGKHEPASKEISERIKSFSDNVLAFVESLSEDDWRKVCESEEWPVGATAYHLAAGHFAIFDMAGMIVRGEDLPPLTMDQINAMSDKQAREHADCTKTDALEALRKNSAEMVAFVAGLTDEELDRKAVCPPSGAKRPPSSSSSSSYSSRPCGTLTA